jgi:hypothetical protein
MKLLIRRLAVAVLLLASARVASAQTVEEVIDKSIAAMGGRAAMVKLKSRAMAGTITLSTPAGDINGTIEMFNAAPNKSRSLIKADLSALGAGQLVVDQRFDGNVGYVLDSLQGNREITGGQLEGLRNGIFPHPFLDYKERGTAAKLTGKEKVGDREAFVLTFEPTSGPMVRNYIDAQTYLPISSIVKVNVPQLGADIEQTTEFLDYKDVDGIKLPFRVKASSSVQNFVVNITKVEHNTTIDPALFSKPAQ